MPVFDPSGPCNVYHCVFFTANTMHHWNIVMLVKLWLPTSLSHIFNIRAIITGWTSHKASEFNFNICVIIVNIKITLVHVGNFSLHVGLSLKYSDYWHYWEFEILSEVSVCGLYPWKPSACSEFLAPCLYPILYTLHIVCGTLYTTRDIVNLLETWSSHWLHDPMTWGCWYITVGYVNYHITCLLQIPTSTVIPVDSLWHVYTSFLLSLWIRLKVLCLNCTHKAALYIICLQAATPGATDSCSIIQVTYPSQLFAGLS